MNCQMIGISGLSDKFVVPLKLFSLKRLEAIYRNQSFKEKYKFDSLD